MDQSFAANVLSTTKESPALTPSGDVKTRESAVAMVEIRQATVSDLDALVTLDLASYSGDAYSGMTLRQLYDAAGPLFSVAADKGQAIGYGLCIRGYDIHEGWFLSLIVAERCRRQGIGRRLMQSCLQRCDEAELFLIKLTVSPTNHPTIKLCEELGFRVDSTISNYFGPDEDRLFLTRDARQPCTS